MGFFKDSGRERGLITSRGGQWRGAEQELWEWSQWVRSRAWVL